MSCQPEAVLTLFSIMACTVLIFEDMRLYMLFSFLLYTKMTLMTVMLARMRVEDEKSIVLILILK